MKRTTAREIAVQLSFYACSCEKPVDELLDEFSAESITILLRRKMSCLPSTPKKAARVYLTSCQNGL